MAAIRWRRLPSGALVAPAALLAAALALQAPAHAAPFDVNLGFATLPSAQGFSYVASGAHAGVPEANIFSVSGGVLTQNSMGQSNGVSGGSIFYQALGGLTTTEVKEIRARIRCLQAEGSAGAPSGEGGFVFGFATGSVQYDFGITPTRIFALAPSGTVLAPGTFDNTQFHDYVFHWNSPSSFTITRDGVLVYTGGAGFAVAANRIFFGDGTGGANARGEITQLRFIQDVATATDPRSWGRIKALYR